ncbi:hypothetical protein V8G54_031930 [Vigna mungo]|uniref:Uncharacterized protein n=1 Tax=Vigna mungo TaxID=3915 RepID=A0AAQ3MKN0_VIGMU
MVHKPYPLSSFLSLPKSKFSQNLFTTKLDLILCEFLRSHKPCLPVDDKSKGISAALSSGEAAKLILNENKKRKKRSKITLEKLLVTLLPATALALRCTLPMSSPWIW